MLSNCKLAKKDYNLKDYQIHNRQERLYLYLYLYHILYIIAEAERKWVPIIKEVVTNRKKSPLKCCHV